MFDKSCVVFLLSSLGDSLLPFKVSLPTFGSILITDKILEYSMLRQSAHLVTSQRAGNEWRLPGLSDWAYIFHFFAFPDTPFQTGNHR